MSANENETLTDIISEIRAAAPFQACPKLVMRLADRIEAAWKRERDELIYSFDPTKAWRSKAPDPVAYAIEGMKGFEEWKRNKEPSVGNAAAMRAALEIVHDYFDAGDTPRTDAAIAVEAALAAPHRNCDRFSAAQLKEMFENEMVVYLTKEATDRDREIARVTANGVIDALFAPSTERKGD